MRPVLHATAGQPVNCGRCGRPSPTRSTGTACCSCSSTRCWSRCLLARVRAAVRPGHPGALQRSAVADDRVRGGRQGGDLRRLRPLPEVVALRRPARLRVDPEGGRGASLVMVGVLYVWSPTDSDLPRSIAVMDLLLTVALIGGVAPRGPQRARAPAARSGAAQGPGGADRRRRRGRPADRARDAAHPGAAPDPDRLRRRRSAQARHAHPRPEGARRHAPDGPSARRRRARRGDHRDPLRARRAAREGRARVPRARHPGAHAARRVRADLRLGGPDAPGARGAGRGRARPGAGGRRDRAGRRLPARPHRARDRRRRLDRRRAVPADRARAPAAARAASITPRTTCSRSSAS